MTTARFAGLAAALALSLGFAAGLARGADDGTSRQLQAMQQQLKAQQQRIDALEGLLRDTIAKDVSDLRKKVDAVADRPPAATPFASWADKLKLSGDLRYRHEFIDDENKSRERNRHRIRARLGLEAHPTEEIAFYLRLVTGSDDPVSTNQTLDGGFSSKDLMLDRAYLDFHPAAFAGAHFLAGKMGVPFFKPGKEQLIWDGDLSVEGLALRHKIKTSDTTTLFANLGGFWAEENSSAADVMLYGAQAGITQHLTEKTKLTLGASTFRYTNVKGSRTLFDDGDPFGNTATKHTKATSSDCYAGSTPVTCYESYYTYDNDYHLCEAFLQFDTKAGQIPLSIYGDFVKNHAADSGKDTGWLAGFTLGKTKKPGSWKVGYNYREVEADAVVGAYNDSDFNGGGTGGEGHKVYAAYQLNKAMQFALTYFWNNKETDHGSDDSYRRLQADVKLKF